MLTVVFSHVQFKRFFIFKSNIAAFEFLLFHNVTSQ